MPEVAVEREGSGQELLLLVHGGSSPRITWQALRPLASRWTLLVVHRRGYPPSPPGEHDFDVDAEDLAPLLAERPHVLAHSYGVLGSLIAAGRNPSGVRSVTLIEPPLFYLAGGDAAVEELEAMSTAVLTQGLDADPETLRRFLLLAGAPPIAEGPLPANLAHTVSRAHGGRLPGEARPALDALREAGVPALVASGGHSEALERICDGLAEQLAGERLVIAGAGHFVQNALSFGPELERHLRAAA